MFRSTRPLLWYHILTRQLMPQENKDRNNQTSVQKCPQRSPKIKSAMTLYQKVHVMRNTIYVESFMLL